MAILDERTLDFISSSVEQTVRLGVRLGELLEIGDLICLSGELGTGKTAFAQGIGRGWGASRHVTSPTYTLVKEYQRLHDGRILFHIDCYRLENEADVVTAGIADILDDGGATMIEWPERISTHLPDDRLWIELRHISETRRGLRIKADGDRALDLLKEFRQSAFGV
ncbi:MAG TPA: tRNA (adenosine(37)-N6)-threonylcarbamoyltransferase complex ATPase subunit type 1 TsaE [candidate division Zixibacteria bacterium]|nr:tRNA (adenosine(37)-N6)-threonylcarbamoyltransferase complex ATPase subunit type 1 TsaE [candidate division Zixibacteria bacterium]